ncbi:MAG: hypothetical protein ACRDZV_04285 [Acidimicrobiia bacterium]
MPDPRSPDVEISVTTPETVRAAFSGPIAPPVARETALGDGCRYRIERGRAGDHRIEYDRRAAFHLAAGGRVLRCWAADPDEPAWRRFLLDTCLGTAALARGYEALHAAGFERDGGAVAVVATEGGGKSTLLAELLHRGRRFLCDDVLCLSRLDGVPVAHPGPPLMNLPAPPRSEGPADQIGRVLAVVDGERWIAVDSAVTRALPLAAVVFLVRGGDAWVTSRRLPVSAAPLLPHSLVSGRDPARLARRFALFADIAANVPLLRVCAPGDLPPARLAAVLEDAIDGIVSRSGSAA